MRKRPKHHQISWKQQSPIQIRKISVWRTEAAVFRLSCQLRFSNSLDTTDDWFPISVLISTLWEGRNMSTITKPSSFSGINKEREREKLSTAGNYRTWWPQTISINKLCLGSMFSFFSWVNISADILQEFLLTFKYTLH